MVKWLLIALMPLALAGCITERAPALPLALGPSDTDQAACLTYAEGPAYGDCQGPAALSASQNAN